jgi:hypothetical protein
MGRKDPDGKVVGAYLYTDHRFVQEVKNHGIGKHYTVTDAAGNAIARGFTSPEAAEKYIDNEDEHTTDWGNQ